MKRKIFSAAFKAKAALDAFRGEKTINELASAYEVHPNQLGQWKKQAAEALPEIFSRRRSKSKAENEALLNRLYQRIGQLEVELDWLKKKTSQRN